MFLAEQRTSQSRLVILVAPCLMVTPYVLTAHNMLQDVPCQCPIIKELIRDYLVDPLLRGLPSVHLTLWLPRDMCSAGQGSLPKSVRHLQRQLEC